MSSKRDQAAAVAAHLAPHLTVVLDKLIELAQAGDPQSIKLLLAYAAGVPTHAIELTGANGGPLQVDDVTRRARIAAIVADAKARTDLA